MFTWLRRRAERRSAAAHPRDPVLAEWFGGAGLTDTGLSVTPATARECAAVDACVGLIEDTIATVPLDLFERGPDGRERRDDHPLHALLHDRPNDWQSSAEFRQMMEGWRLTYGNAYARIRWQGSGVPQALEPLHPDEVRPFRAPAGGIAYRWQPQDGPAQTLLGMEVLHLRDKPFKRNLIEGESRVTRHREAIGRALATGRYLSKFFANYAVPKAFLEAEGTLTAEQMKAAQEAFERRHGGLENAHRIGILNKGFKLNQLGVNNDEAQVIEAYRLSVGEIAQIHGIPPHMIGLTDKTTSWGTGIEQQSIGAVIYAFRPKFVVWEQALNLALMSSGMRQRFYFEFNVDGLLRGDFKSRMDGYALMIQWGLATPNEIRRQMNLAPMPGGDERLTPLNMVPATRIMDVLLKTGPGNEARTLDGFTQLMAALAGKANGSVHPGGHA